MVAQIIMTLIFLTLGAVFASGKGADLIAGYNTLSEEKKRQYDEKKLLKNMSLMMFSLAGCTVIGLAGSVAGLRWLLSLETVLFIACIVFFLIRLNRNSRK